MHTHRELFNGPLSGTTRVSRYQKGKTNLDFTEARESECQWHQLGRMQVCTSLQTDNLASTPPLRGICNIVFGYLDWRAVLSSVLNAECHCMLTDWDLGTCLHYECRRKQLRKPPQLNSWIDLRATYRVGTTALSEVLLSNEDFCV